MLEFCEVCLVIHLCHAHVNHWRSSKPTNWNRWWVKWSPPPEYPKRLSYVFDLGVKQLYGTVRTYLSLLGPHLGLHAFIRFQGQSQGVSRLQRRHSVYTFIHRLHLRYTFICLSMEICIRIKCMWPNNMTATLYRQPLQITHNFPESSNFFHKGYRHCIWFSQILY